MATIINDTCAKRKLATNEVLRNRFRELVDAQGIPKTRCAKEIGISYKVFSNIYNYGKGRKLIALILISKYFNVSSDYLLGLSNNKEIKRNIKDSSL